METLLFSGARLRRDSETVGLDTGPLSEIVTSSDVGSRSFDVVAVGAPWIPVPARLPTTDESTSAVTRIWLPKESGGRSGRVCSSGRLSTSSIRVMVLLPDVVGNPELVLISNLGRESNTMRPATRPFVTLNDNDLSLTPLLADPVAVNPPGVDGVFFLTAIVFVPEGDTGSTRMLALEYNARQLATVPLTVASAVVPDTPVTMRN